MFNRIVFSLILQPNAVKYGFVANSYLLKNQYFVITSCE